MKFLPVLTVRELMISNPYTVPPQTPLQEAVRVMNQHGIGAVLIADNGKLLGIFTERDLLRHTGAAPHGWRERPVADWMTPEPWTIGPDASWEQAFSLLDTLHVRHVPVVEHDRIIGILTARDLMARYNDFLNQQVEERTRELREAYQRLQERDNELRLHMEVAGRLQARLLPGQPPDWPEVEWAARYEPLDPLGGDYYDFAHPDERHFGVLIADASGHSIPAAMVAIMARTAFASASRTTTSPARVLADMNRRLHGLTGEHFVTAFYGVYDRQTRHFAYANAGHPFPYHLEAAPGRVRPLAARGLMLGVLAETAYDEEELILQPGDRLLLYTDGIIECPGESGEPFGAARIESHLLECRDQSPQSLVQLLADKHAAFRGGRPANDDMTLLAAAVF